MKRKGTGGRVKPADQRQPPSRSTKRSAAPSLGRTGRGQRPPPPAQVPPPQLKDSILPALNATQYEIWVLIRKMAPRYVKFARLIAAGSEQTQAAIDCGYAPTNATSQGSIMAGDLYVRELVEKLQMLDVLTEAYISKPALRRVLIEVMERAEYHDRVAAVRAATRLEGYDRVKVEIVEAAASGMDPETLRKELAERLARQRRERNED